MKRDLAFHIGMIVGTALMGIILKDPIQQISNFTCLSLGYWACRFVWRDKK